MEGLTRAAAGVLLAAVTATTTSVPGTYALLGGKQQVYAKATVAQSGPSTVITVTQSAKDGGAPIRSYTQDMTKLMHMVAISDDFRQFMHVHPAFDPKTGAFRETLTLQPTHTYYVYSDSQPAGMTQQVFRFTVGPNGPPPSATAAAPSTPSPADAHAGPYTVAMQKTTLAANTMQMLRLEITKAGKPATDLAPYLGAAGHAVFINTKTLAYVHVHPMVKGDKDDDMGAMGGMKMSDNDGPGKAGPHLLMHVPVLPAGIYELWFQFKGAGALYTAPFTIAVQ